MRVVPAAVYGSVVRRALASLQPTSQATTESLNGPVAYSMHRTALLGPRVAATTDGSDKPDVPLTTSGRPKLSPLSLFIWSDFVSRRVIGDRNQTLDAP